MSLYGCLSTLSTNLQPVQELPAVCDIIQVLDNGVDEPNVLISYLKWYPGHPPGTSASSHHPQTCIWGHSKLSIGVMCVCGCLCMTAHHYTIGTCPGCTLHSPSVSWDRPLHPCDQGRSGKHEWMKKLHPSIYSLLLNPSTWSLGGWSLSQMTLGKDGVQPGQVPQG